MPNIRVVETPDNLGLRPTETGIEATAAAARRGGSFFREAAEATNQTGSRVTSAIRDAGDVAVKALDHYEISRGAKTFAELQNGLTQQWNDLVKNADPNDPAVAAKFREEVVESALEKFGSGFNTERSQAFAESKANSIRTEMFHKTQADMSTLAGIAVKSNLSKSLTAMSNTAITDPAAVPGMIKGLDHTVGEMVASSPTLSPSDAARVRSEVSQSMKSEIVKSGAMGAIQKSANPEATADEWIKKYPDVISGSEAKALAANARQQIRARNYDYELNRRREKEEAQTRSNEKTNQYLIEVEANNPKLKNDPTAQRILNDPDLQKTDKRNLLSHIERNLKPETESRISAATFVGLLRDMRAPDADLDAVMQKAWDARLLDPGKPGSMTEKDFNQFRQEITARKTPEGAALEKDRGQFFKNYGQSIAGPSYLPQMGDPKIYNAEMDARRLEADLRKQGKDPHLLYDPSSEYFIGKPANLQKWRGSMQSDLTTRVETAKPDRPETPPGLRGIASLSYSASRKQYRDDTTGKIYDATGKEIGQ